MRKIKRFFLLFLALLSIRPLSASALEDGQVIRHGDGMTKRIALTFDDGPHPEYTPLILDILEEYGVKATFFVIGENADRYPDLVRREADEGHEIGNHTYTHPITSSPSEKEIIEEVGRTEETILRITGSRPKLFRPPGGCVFDGIGTKMKRMGYTTVLWSVDTVDWKRPGTDKIVSEVLGNTKSGSIILCHDFVVNSQTPTALAQWLPKMLGEGYEFVTVSELIGESEGQ